MTSPNIDATLVDPLAVHFALKERGSNFSKIARELSTPNRKITHYLVRAVVYGHSRTHYVLIMNTIRDTLKKHPFHRPRMKDDASL